MMACATCTSSALGRSGPYGWIMAHATTGLTKLAPDTSSSASMDYDALYQCPRCEAYRVLGVEEASKDYHSVWKKPTRAHLVSTFGAYLKREAKKRKITVDALADEIVARTVVDVDPAP